MKRSNRKQRRRNQDYQDKRRSGAARENQPEEPEVLARSEEAPTQGLRLQSANESPLLLMEARNGMLVDVPEDRLDDWLAVQGQEEEPQLTEKDERLVQKLLEMIYGKEEK